MAHPSWALQAKASVVVHRVRHCPTILGTSCVELEIVDVCVVTSMTREEALEASVKELGQLANKAYQGGKFRPDVVEILERARDALRMEKKNED